MHLICMRIRACETLLSILLHIKQKRTYYIGNLSFILYSAWIAVGIWKWLSASFVFCVNIWKDFFLLMQSRSACKIWKLSGMEETLFPSHSYLGILLENYRLRSVSHRRGIHLGTLETTYIIYVTYLCKFVGENPSIFSYVLY